MIDPCNKASAIGTYDPNFNGDHTFDGGGGGACGCSSANANEASGEFTSNDYLLDPKGLFSSGTPLVGILELFVCTLRTASDPTTSGYYNYYVNSEKTSITGSYVIMRVVAQSGDFGTELPSNSSDASNQIKFVRNSGVTFKTLKTYHVSWKFSFAYK